MPMEVMLRMLSHDECPPCRGSLHSRILSTGPARGLDLSLQLWRTTLLGLRDWREQDLVAGGVTRVGRRSVGCWPTSPCCAPCCSSWSPLYWIPILVLTLGLTERGLQARGAGEGRSHSWPSGAVQRLSQPRRTLLPAVVTPLAGGPVLRPPARVPQSGPAPAPSFRPPRTMGSRCGPP